MSMNTMFQRAGRVIAAISSMMYVLNIVLVGYLMSNGETLYAFYTAIMACMIGINAAIMFSGLNYIARMEEAEK